MQKRRFHDLNVASYIIQSANYEFKLKERPGSNLLYFKVDGKFDNKYITLAEDWNGNLEVYYHASHVMTVIEDPVSGETEIDLGENFVESSLNFIIGDLILLLYTLLLRDTSYFSRSFYYILTHL